MAENIGRITTIKVGNESAWGTESTVNVALPVLEFNPNPKVEKVQDESAVGRIEKGIGMDIVKQWSEPTLSCIIYQDAIGYFLRAIFGTLSTGSITDSAYPHTFTIKNDQAPQSMSLKYEDSNQSLVILGAVVNTATFTFVNGEYAKVDISFIGKYPAADSDTFAYTAENAYTACMATVKFGATLAALGAAIPFQEATLEINKNAEAIFGIGSCEPTEVTCKSTECSGSFSLVMTAETYRTLYSANTDQGIQLAITNTAVTIGAATNPSLTIELANVNVNEWGQSSGLDDLITEDFGFMANYLLTDNMIDAVLVNTKATYALS